jgi:phage baseplate assembly protein W
VAVFLEEDPDIAALGEDLRWPLEVDGNADLAMVAGVENVEQSMTLRACTTPGEIVHKENDGIAWSEYQNGPADPGALASLRAVLTEQYAAREPRLVSVNVDITIDPDGSGDVTAVIEGQTKTGGPARAELPLTIA